MLYPKDSLVLKAIFRAFSDNFGNYLQEVTTTALINAVLATEAAQAALKGLGDVIAEAVADGVISDEDIGAIQLAQQFYRRYN